VDLTYPVNAMKGAVTRAESIAHFAAMLSRGEEALPADEVTPSVGGSACGDPTSVSLKGEVASIEFPSQVGGRSGR
jgi:hypothetical protein